MKYDYSQNGVSCNRDFYGEHFSNDLKCNYMISIHDEVIGEGENPKELAKQLEAYAKQLQGWANHFKRMKKR